MSRLRDVTRRLETAIERLEGVVAARVAEAAEARGGENGKKVDEILAALESARQENASLQEVTEAVSDRLDAAIGRLRSILEP